MQYIWSRKNWLNLVKWNWVQIFFPIFSYKDGVDLKEDSRVTVNRDGGPNGSYEIIIKKVTSGDAGSYSAKASNDFGAEECVAAVTVKGKNFTSEKKP